VRWRWPWRGEPDGEESRAAEAAANAQLDDSRSQTRRVNEATRAAHHLARQVDRFARDVEATMHLRGTH
jgi:hypothetical protein